MHSDSIYLIGSTHTTCQDYAANWDGRDYSIIAVADGCSSSPKSDVGARLLVETFGGPADELGLHFFQNFGQEATIPDERARALYRFQYRVASLRNAVGISTSAFDATLLACVASKDSLLLFLWGDGHVRIEHTDGSTTTLDIDFDHNQNAPYYLSYEIFDRAEKYRELFGSPVPTRLWNSPRLDRPSELDDRYPVFEIPSAGIRSVSLFSDGASSFLYGQDLVQTDFVTRQCCDFKSTTGELVKRRVGKCQKNWRREGLQHTDDLAQATILLQEAAQ